MRLQARLKPEEPAISDSQAKALIPSLHAIDVAVVQEMRSGAIYGQIADAEIARLLPLLVQRQTFVQGKRLTLLSSPLVPRLRIRPGPLGGVMLSLALSTPDGEWMDLEAGRLIAGHQAYFIRGAEAAPVASPKPWELATWARQLTVELGASLTPAERDRLVRDLQQAGVPGEDLASLAVRRDPPEKISLRFLAPDEDTQQPTVRLEVMLQYAGTAAPLLGPRPTDLYLAPTRTPGVGLIERDLAVEENIRHQLRTLGMRFDPKNLTFVAQGEAAIRLLDPHSDVLPSNWQVDRTLNQPRFVRDLSIDARVALNESQGLMEVAVGINALDDDKTAAALIEMKDLLAWLGTGKTYVRLPDGSYVAPSPRFRRSLRLLDDLGAHSERVLVSPLCVGLLRALDDNAAVRSADEATRSWLAEISGRSAPEVVTPPIELQPVMRDYQQRGLDWLAMLHRHRLTGILADDMGLGKTLQALALLVLVSEKDGRKPSLVVAPTSVVTVWRDEALRFTPGLNVALWHGAPQLRQGIDINQQDLVVTSYGVLRRDAALLSNTSFRYVILDEAQSAKNAATQNAKAIRMLKSERRLALTGTPIENRPEELWAAFDFLAPGFLGSLRQFRKRYARPIAHGEENALGLLRARIQPFVMRRLKTEVAKELPPSIETTVRCEMLPTQRALYEHLAGELKESVQKKIEKVGIERAHLDILAALTRLRQICCDPTLLPGPTGKRPGSAKLELFEELMREALASERRVVVFSQFVEMQKRLITVIRRLGVEPLWLHGGSRNRDKIVDAFQTPSGPPVIVISLRAGGTGLTLTRADTVMHYDPWWNPAVERQASDRTHRLGQTQQVTIYKLICARSIEERVVAMAERKAELARDLLGSEGSTGIKQISTSEVLDLLSGA